MQQRQLWQGDGYVILNKDDTGKIGKGRLKRYLLWLDSAAQDWTRPDLDAYGDYLAAEHKLQRDTIPQALKEVREHYLAVLSDTDNYAYIPQQQQASFVDGILYHLGFNPLMVRYVYITGRANPNDNENTRILFPPTNSNRATYLTDFIHWLNETGRHWSHPDLLDYKEYIIANDGRDALNSILTVIRNRYQEIINDDAVLSLLLDAERESFLRDLRKRLAYMDAFPKKEEATREMLVDDPAVTQSWLTAEQVNTLVCLPDTQTLMGLRDRALLTLSVVTGIHRFETPNVQVEHLKHDYHGQLALYVPASHLYGERYITYGESEGILAWLDEWLDAAEIHEGAVFRGMYGSNAGLRPGAIAPETASDVLSRYPLLLNGYSVPLIFGDLRATAGRRWYDTDIPLDEIQYRLGINNRQALLNLLGLKIRDAFG